MTNDNPMQIGIEETFRYWVKTLSRGFPGLPPFDDAEEFVALCLDHVRRKENAALQRAINVLALDGDKHKAAIILVRSCMRGE